jgi:hypothetical protein
LIRLLFRGSPQEGKDTLSLQRCGRHVASVRLHLQAPPEGGTTLEAPPIYAGPPNPIGSTAFPPSRPALFDHVAKFSKGASQHEPDFQTIEACSTHTLLSADILALLLHRTFAHRMLWNMPASFV